MGKGKSILFAAAVGVLGLGVASLNAEPPKTPASTPPANTPAKPTGNTPPAGKHEEKKEAKKDTGAAMTGAKVGTAAPEFNLTSVDGKAVKLSDYKGKIVVIEWFNPGCPWIVGTHKSGAFKNLTDKYGKDVTFLAINSSAKGQEGSDKDMNAKMAKEWNVSYPVLLDGDGKVGHAYGAKTTPHMFVIGTDGKVAYNGALDDRTKPDEAGKTNYVANAIDALMKHETVATSETKPFGCPVKYSDSK
jgi:peroxiredoxin